MMGHVPRGACHFVCASARRVLLFALLLPALALPACGRQAPLESGSPVAGIATLPPFPTRTPLPTVTPGPAPLIALPALDGTEVSLDTWKGKGVILNFWATWCFPCREEMPLLAAIDDRYDEIVVVGVNYLESSDEAAAFVEEYALEFPILLDTRGLLATDLGVVALPTTFFLDGEGMILRSHIGPLTAAMLDEEVEALRASLAPGK